MLPKPRRPMLLVLAAALAVLALPAAAGVTRAVAPTAPAAPQDFHHPFHRLRECLRILHLSDAQKAEIVAIFEAAKPRVEEIFATLKADREALKAELEKDPPIPCDVGNAFLQLHADREAARAFFASVRDQVLAVLTPEQEAKLAGCLQAPRLPANPPTLEAAPEE